MAQDGAGAAGGARLAGAVLQLAAGGATRAVPLGDRTVLRTPERPDHRPGQALLLHAPAGAEGLRLALVEARARLGPAARVVVPVEDPSQQQLLGTVVAHGGSAVPLALVEHPDPARWAARAAPPPDVALGPPGDERAWHGLTVLQRHVDDLPTRGEDDERHRWWVAGLADLVGAGRARVLRAARHGTPVGAGTLRWEPKVDVGDGHAGLAVVTDVVVHPAHRRLGVGRALAADLLARHLVDFPRARCLATVPGGLVDAAAGDGWAVLARLLVVDLDG